MQRYLILLSMVASAWAGQLSIAVSELEPQGLSASEAAIISDRLRDELLSTGKFRVMERSMMDEILKEQSLQGSGACSNSQCQVQMGRLLGVDRLVVGRVGKFGSMFTLSVRMLSVESGEILESASEDHEGAMEGLLKGPLKKIAFRLANPTPNGQAATSATATQAQASVAPTADTSKAQAAAAATSEMKAPETSKPGLGKRILQVGLGVGSLTFAGLGYYFNTKVKSENTTASNALDTYMKDHDNAASTTYNDAKVAGDKDVLLRNVCFGLGGATLVAFALTFTF